MNNFKSGFVTIVGRPNVGKSTLLNALTGEKIAIVSNKPQTTRNKILTILTDDSSQIIFVDTPGVHAPRTKLGEYMNKVVTDAVDEVDAVLFVTEAGQKLLNNEKEILESLFGKKIPVILVINKADTVKNKEDLLAQIADANTVGSFAAIVPISALRKDGVKFVLEEIKKFLPGKLFSTPVPRNVRLSEAPSYGMPIMYYDKHSKGARAYKDISKELIKRL